MIGLGLIVVKRETIAVYRTYLTGLLCSFSTHSGLFFPLCRKNP